jgi:hypothetical protein
VNLYFADLGGVPGAVRSGRQQPLIAVPWPEERVGHHMFAKPAGNQQSNALVAPFDEMV